MSGSDDSIFSDKSKSSEKPLIKQVNTMRPQAAEEIIEGLHEGGVNFVSMVPESEFLTAQQAILEDARFQCVPVCNETVGTSVCAGAWAGGKRPAMLMGAAGFTVASYALAGVCIRHGIPVLLLVTSREIGDQNWIFSVWNAHTLRPVLKAFNFPYVRVRKISEARNAVRNAARTCFAWLKPVAVLLEEEVIF